MRLPQETIRRKRDGATLDAAEIADFIAGLTDGRVGEGQAAAFAMAVYVRGMSVDERVALTRAMTRSGRVLAWDLPGPVLDKHSTGGIGDAVSLVLAPMVATCGGYVPMISGRGLGHTGGTLDKLASIPGYDTTPDLGRFRRVVSEVGCAIIGQTADLAPADRRLYAIRDVTGTVESLDLITASILSKKLAAGLDGLVMDVKVGSGAFMRDVDSARSLAQTMVELGTDSGVATTALLTDMNTPLGLTIGNANEVREAVEVLAGGGPSDVVELTLALAREMLALAGNPEADVEAALANGRAMDAWRAMIRAQGGDPDAAMPTARETHTVRAPRAGTVTRMDALGFGIAAWRLGAGRARAEDAVVHAAGIDLHVKPGAVVTEGQPLFTLLADDPSRFGRALTALDGAWDIGGASTQLSASAAPAPDRAGTAPVAAASLVLERITA